MADQNNRVALRGSVFEQRLERLEKRRYQYQYVSDAAMGLEDIHVQHRLIFGLCSLRLLLANVNIKTSVAFWL